MGCGVFLLYKSLKTIALERWISGTVRSAAGSAAPGRVELGGTAAPSVSLLDPVYNLPCAYYRVEVNEAEVGAGKAGRGLRGLLNNRDRRANVFGAPVVLYSADSSGTPLLVEDGTGAVPVYPQGARFLLKNTVDVFEKRQGDSFAFADPSVAQFLNGIPRERGVHLRAVIIRGGDPLWVWGCAGEAKEPLTLSEQMAPVKNLAGEAIARLLRADTEKMKALDADKDGELDAAEWEAGLKETLAGEQEKQKQWQRRLQTEFRAAVREKPGCPLVIADGPRRRTAGVIKLRWLFLLLRGPLVFALGLLYLLYRTNVLGGLYEDGWGPVPRDASRASALYGANCLRGDADACALLSRLKVRTIIEIKAQAQAAAFFRAAAAGGAKKEFSLPGQDAPEKRAEPDRIRIKVPPSEAALARQACDGGDMGKCLLLGAMYYAGRGVAQEYDKAAVLVKQACDGGEMKGCTMLGSMYMDGRGLPMDIKLTAFYLKKACSGGDGYGCGILGALYSDGLGVKQDHSRAAVLYKKACDGGVAQGCTSLGKAYASGLGVRLDEASAAALYKRGCAAGNVQGCTELRNMGLLRRLAPTVEVK